MKRFLPNFLALLLIATIAKAWFNNFYESEQGPWDFAQRSPALSQQKGIYVCPVQASPASFLWKGTPITFNDVWIERRVHTELFCVWFWRIVQSGEDILCVTLNEPEGKVADSDSPIFWCDEGEYGGNMTTYRIQGNDVFRETWLKPGTLAKQQATLTVKDIEASDSNPPMIKLTWKADH